MSRNLSTSCWMTEGSEPPFTPARTMSSRWRTVRSSSLCSGCSRAGPRRT